MIELHCSCGKVFAPSRDNSSVSGTSLAVHCPNCKEEQTFPVINLGDEKRARRDEERNCVEAAREENWA